MTAFNRLHTMNISIPSILFGLAGKFLLNWGLVFFQRNHICKSFLGVFSLSLAVVDTTLTISVTTLHIHPDGTVFLLGVKLTRYHVCLLAQVFGQVYDALQWPVVVLAGLDHFCTFTQRLQPTSAARTRLTVCLLLSGLLWSLATLYIFLLSDFVPVLEDASYYQIHQCWVFHTSQILQVALFLLLTLCCAALHAGWSTCWLKIAPQKDQTKEQSKTCTRGHVVHQVVCIFLNTWGLFLFFLLPAMLLLPVGIPAYLGLNIAWLCFLNSLLIAVVLCAVCPASQLVQSLAAVPADSFCEWRDLILARSQRIKRDCTEQALTVRRVGIS